MPDTNEKNKRSPLPLIVHFNKNHYVVVYKLKNDVVYISDPAYGLITYTKEEFISRWIGIKLVAFKYTHQYFFRFGIFYQINDLTNCNFDTRMTGDIMQRINHHSRFERLLKDQPIVKLSYRNSKDERYK